MAVGNNGSRMVGNTEFYGGLSTDRKIGIENSYYDGECLDVRKSPSQMTVLPMSRTLPDSGVITGLMTAMTQSKDGVIWGIDENGKVYKIDEDNAITAVSAGSCSITNVDSSTITNVEFDNSYTVTTVEGIQGEEVLEYDGDSAKWKIEWEGGGGYVYLTKEQVKLDYGITYSGTPEDGDSITAEYTRGAYSSGFSLENYDIDDALWWADGGHKLFSYGKVLNPTGSTRDTGVFELMHDNSKYVLYGIDIQQIDDIINYRTESDVVRSAGTQNVEVKTSVSEAEADKILYLPSAIPIAKIGVRFTAKGSGTVRIEIHDENDNIVASSLSMDAGDVSTDGYTDFMVRPNPANDPSPSNQFTCTPWAGDTADAGAVLHIHIVASSSGYTVRSSVAGSLWLTADITSTAYILHETFNKKHPIAVYDKLYIGNGRYVATKESSPLNYLDDTLFIQDALRLDDGFEVCSFGSSDEYLMIGAEKYSAGSTRGFQAGRIYFWDRQTEGPNFYIDCNMGSPKAIYNFGNIVYIIIAGALYAYTGGKELVKVRTLKGTDTEYSGRNSVTEVYPNMMAIRREVLMIAFPSHTTAYSIRHGVYAFGSIDKNYPNCFTYNYKIPGATTSETLDQHNSDNQQLRIGCVYNFNDTLFYSYEVENLQTGTSRVALAVVDNDSGTSTTYLWKSLQYDAGSPAFQKMALRVGIYFDPLPADTTITPIYRIDDGEWQTGPATAVAGDRYITCEINKRFHELQYGFVGTTGNDLLTPVIKQVSAEIRVLNEEAKL